MEQMVLMLVPAFFVASFLGVVVGCWGVFAKAGQPSWAAVVPGYNLFLLVRIAGLNEWWGLLFLVPAVNMVLWFYICDQLALKSDRGIGTSLGLMCLGFVFFPSLGFGQASFAEPKKRRRSEEDDEDDRPRSSRREEEDVADEPRSPKKRKRRAASVPEMDLRVKLLLAGGLALLVLVIGGIWYAVRTIRRAPYRPHIAGYTAAPGGAAAPGTKVRKMVVVDVADRDIDGIQFDLPVDLRPSSPEEVTTVAQLRWNKQQVGTYSTGGAAYQWHCAVTVIDLKTRGTIGSRDFAGSQPPDSFQGRQFESRSGDKPNDAVVNYLKSLRSRD